MNIFNENYRHTNCILEKKEKMNNEICICENIYRINTAKIGEEINFDWSSSSSSSSFFKLDDSDSSEFEELNTFEKTTISATRTMVIAFLVLFLVIGIPLNMLILMTSVRFRKQAPSSSWEGFYFLQIKIISVKP